MIIYYNDILHFHPRKRSFRGTILIIIQVIIKQLPVERHEVMEQFDVLEEIDKVLFY